jgi:peptidoglycan/LPS O-acetylase OafA/YrhL
VIAVVLFHFNPAWVPGGFAGVDVFFVISGFLMTGIIFRGLESKNFNLFQFYIDRANRIVPALTFLCVFVFIFGFFYQYDVEFNHTLKQITTSLLFFSNFYFWSTADYFSPGSDTNILLHTWSLSVEWQFYIVYPIGLLVLSKFIKLNKAKYVIFTLCFIAFLISIYASPKWVSSSYYLLPTRAWEMLFGGVAYFTKVKPLINSKQLRFISLIGFILIIYSYAFFDESDVWPGSLALIPVLGAYLILIANVENIALDNKLSQFLGKLSYSLYLWHWPFVYLVNRYFNYAIEAVAIGIICSIAMSWFSYVWIEKKGLNTVTKAIFCLILLLSLVSTFMINALPRGISKTEANDLVNYYEYNKDKIKVKTPWISNVCLEPKECSQGGVFLWGDSHANALKFGLTKVFNEELSVITTASCTPSVKYPDVKLAGRALCNKNNRMAMAHIANKKPNTVIMATRFRHEKTDWNEITLTLLNLGVENVVLVGPVPQFSGSLPLLVANKYLYDERVRLADMDMSIFNTDIIMKGKDGSKFKYISVLDEMCEERKCKFRVDKGNNKSLISFDYGHLSDVGSEFVVKKIVVPNLP